MIPRSLKGLLLLNESAFLVLLLVTAGLGIWYAYHWQQSSEEALRINTLLLGAERIRGDMYGQVEEVIRARLTEDPSALERYEPYAERIAARFVTLERLALEQERPALQYLRDSYRVLQADMNKVFTSPYEITDAARIKLLDRAHEQWMLADFESALTVFNQILERRHQVLSASQTTWARWTRVLAPIPIVLALFLVVFSLHRLYRWFLIPMRRMLVGVQQLSRGELEHTLDEQGVEELRELAQSFNRMAGDLARSRDALVQSERQAALGALVPVVAHNIRNPLASIRATAQLMDAGDSDEELAQNRQGIIDCVDQLERWVRALLSYLNPLEPRRAWVSMADVLDAACGLLEHKLVAHGLSIERHGFDGNTNCYIDPDLTEQAIYGVINNAIEASPRGAVVTVRVAGDSEQITVSIEDHGSGMAFSPKPNGLSPGPSTKSYGTGLGIPFAFKVIQAHGADIDYDSDASGTRVRISIPTHHEADASPHAHD